MPDYSTLLQWTVSVAIRETSTQRSTNSSLPAWASGLTLIGAFWPAGLSNLSIYTQRLCVCVCVRVVRQRANVDVWADGKRVCSGKCEGDSDVGGFSHLSGV